MASNVDPRGRTAVERRVGALLAVAEQYRTTLPVDRFAELLPREGPDSPGEVRDWFDQHPDQGRIVDARVTTAGRSVPPPLADREARGRRFLEEAEWIARCVLRPVRRWVRTVAVTGSAAYGEPAAGDDLDLLVVTAPGAVWTFLLYSYFASRVRRRGTHADGPSHWCFNYIVDEREARRAFSESRGFLFAREALSARPVGSPEYYRGLVGTAPWLGAELPRLYDRWRLEGLPELPPSRPAPIGVRVLDRALYPVLAAYLHLVALVRNDRLRRTGRASRCFRVEAHPDRLTFESERFEVLREIYSPAESSVPGRPERA